MSLRRAATDICYYRTRDGDEVDFVTSDRRLVQVCWSLEDEDKRHRELRALSQAMEELDVREATLVTVNGGGDHTKEGRTVHVVPAWQFALDSSRST
jgi:predicted AAA+ superfamily ATPase